MLIFILEDFLKVKTNWAYDQYRIMQRIVCWFVFAVSSDAYILSYAKASFLQLFSASLEEVCVPCLPFSSLSLQNLSVSYYTSLYEKLFF